MKVLIACETSGTVRDAFIARGHNALSCDLLPTETGGPHRQGDIRDILDEPWDMIISFPPCTHIASSGARWFREKQADGRQQSAIDFFMLFADHPCPKIAIENPVGIMSTQYRKPDQIIQPWQFGHDASKKTCLWLKNLLPLQGTKNIPGRTVDGKERWGNQTDSGQNKLTPSDDRWKLRSKTYQGIADAMSKQWG